MHATDESIEHTLFSAGYAIAETGLVVDGRPDAVCMLSLQAAGNSRCKATQQYCGVGALNNSSCRSCGAKCAQGMRSALKRHMIASPSKICLEDTDTKTQMLATIKTQTLPYSLYTSQGLPPD